MANHVRKQLRDAIVTALTGLTTTGARVYAERKWGLDATTELPALLISTPGEAAQEHDIHGATDRTVTLTVTAVVKATGAVQDTADQIAKEVETVMTAAAGVTVAGRRLYPRYTGAAFDMDDGADRVVATLEMTFEVELSTAAGVPDALL